MKNLSKLYFTLLTVALFTSSGCDKYLEEKSDAKLVTPSSLGDLQALLDNLRMNTAFSSAGEISTDDFYLTDADYNALSTEYPQRMYTWQAEHLFVPGTTTVNDWMEEFGAIYVTNAVLKELNTMKHSAQWDYIKGQALALRAFHYFDAAQIWCLPYDSSTSGTDPGMPLRIDPDFNDISVRSSLGETYRQITKDLKESIPLLPVIGTSPMRVSGPLPYALLSRTYLAMRDYELAKVYADSCLQLYNELIDYNTLAASDSYPFKPLHRETIFWAQLSASEVFSGTRPKVNRELYQSYAENDLRKVLFYRINSDGSIRFKGFYGGEPAMFNGISTSEIYLTRAECLARNGNIQAAMNDLNTVLEKRWKTGSYIPFTISDQEEALNTILQERRKELTRRGLRWMDIRRLNKEGANIRLSRTVNGQSYSLLPNDLRYALPIPEDVISLSGMMQNSR